MAAAGHVQEFKHLEVDRYEPYDFNGEVVSLKTAGPHLTRGYALADGVISAAHRALTDLSSYLQQQYPELSGLKADALTAKGKEYEQLKGTFRQYHGFVENAQAYLHDLQRGIALFDRARLCATDAQTLALLDPEFSGKVTTFMGAAQGKIEELKLSESRMRQRITQLKKVEDEVNSNLGWFGKAIAGGGSVSAWDAARQLWKPREHRPGESV